MNRIFLIALMMLSITVRSQNRSASLKDIEYAQVLKIHQKNIFIAGFTFEVAKPDGYSTNGYLKKYSENLQLLWSLKLDFTNKSEINHIEFYKDRIYALVTHGKNTNSTSETSLYLYVISSAGKVIEKVKIGDKSFNRRNNVVIVNDKMYFSYSQAATIYYAQMRSLGFTPVLVEYDLKTKALIKKAGNNARSFSEKIFLHGSRLYVAGVYENKIRVLVSEFPFQKTANTAIKETVIQSKKEEFFLDAYFSGNELIIVSYFSGVYGDLEKYLKITTINTTDDSRKEKILLCKDLHLTDIDLEVTYNDKETSWLLVRNEKKAQRYVQIDKTGTILSNISVKGDETVRKFIIADQMQVQCFDNKIAITNEPVVKMNSIKK